jgi:hypothetical protein
MGGAVAVVLCVVGCGGLTSRAVRSATRAALDIVHEDPLWKDLATLVKKLARAAGDSGAVAKAVTEGVVSAIVERLGSAQLGEKLASLLPKLVEAVAGALRPELDKLPALAETMARRTMGGLVDGVTSREAALALLVQRLSSAAGKSLAQAASTGLFGTLARELSREQGGFVGAATAAVQRASTAVVRGALEELRTQLGKGLRVKLDVDAGDWPSTFGEALAKGFTRGIVSALGDFSNCRRGEGSGCDQNLAYALSRAVSTGLNDGLAITRLKYGLVWIAIGVLALLVIGLAVWLALRLRRLSAAGSERSDGHR